MSDIIPEINQVIEVKGKDSYGLVTNTCICKSEFTAKFIGEDDSLGPCIDEETLPLTRIIRIETDKSKTEPFIEETEGIPH